MIELTSWDSYLVQCMPKDSSRCKYQISVVCNDVVRVDLLLFLLILCCQVFDGISVVISRKTHADVSISIDNLCLCVTLCLLVTGES